MEFTFYKYQGTGNDFVIIDNRNLLFPKENTKEVARLCNRNFGVGADGLILLENDEKSDFKMIYFNADGSESTMCGNGGRCIVAFAKKLGIFEESTTFIAIDGLHTATVNNDLVALQMIDVEKIEVCKEYSFLDTGSPHHVQLAEDLENYRVDIAGKRIRKSYGEEGSNVNFVEKIDENYFDLRTYERGVEAETLACGTGATATAIAMHKTRETHGTTVDIKVLGGELQISFDENNGVYTNIFLKGPATLVFKGEITIK